MPAEAPLEPEAMTFSRDARLIAAGDATGEVVVWEVASGRLMARFPGHRQDGKVFKVDFLTFSPGGRLLACGDLLDDEITPAQSKLTSRIRLIDLAKNAEGATISSADKQVFNSAAFSADEKTIATASYSESAYDLGGLICLFDVSTGKKRASARRTTIPDSIAYTGDGSLLVTADRKWIELRDPTDLRERVVLYQGQFTSREGTIAFSPNGRTLASSNGQFKLWDLRAASEPPTTGGHRFRVTCLAYSPDGRTLVSGSLDRSVKLWDVASRSPRLTLLGHAAGVVRVAYAPDGQAVATADSEGQVRIWDPATGASRAVLQNAGGSPWLLTFALDGPDLGLIAWSYGKPFKVMRWDAATARRLPLAELAAGLSPPLAYSSDGRLCVCLDGSRIQVFDAVTGESRSTISAKHKTRSLLVTRDGHTVFQMTSNDSIVIHRQLEGDWKTEDLFAGDPELVESGSAEPGERMTATADGRRLAVQLDDSVQVFDTIKRLSIARLPIESASALALSPDGGSLAIGRSDGEILIYGVRMTVAGGISP